ncbi:MAG: hypothetical protein FJ126_07545 [Deltaproteobacteria bacterium]|nr:hypothetical protein [Deltaproteobacteria bacterium]
MGEGVDPTRMCQSLVEKMARGKYLEAAAVPELLVLFEDWLEELEGEVSSLIKETGEHAPEKLAPRLGLSPASAAFLVGKLKREGKR